MVATVTGWVYQTCTLKIRLVCREILIHTRHLGSAHCFVSVLCLLVTSYRWLTTVTVEYTSASNPAAFLFHDYLWVKPQTKY